MLRHLAVPAGFGFLISIALPLADATASAMPFVPLAGLVLIWRDRVQRRRIDNGRA